MSSYRITEHSFGDRQPNSDLTIVLLSELSAILPCGTDRMLALFRKTGVVDDPR